MVTPLRVCLTISIFASAASAQGFSPTMSGNPGGLPSLGMGADQPVLVDPKRMEIRQSVTVSAASGGGSSMSQSFYQSRIDYRLSDPLILHLDLGILTPLSHSGPATQGIQRGAYLLPSVGLEYRPSESVRMYFQYSSVPSAPVGSSGGLPWQ